MAIAVKCRACGAAFAVKDELAGKRIRCVKCKDVLTLPGVAPGVTTATRSTEQPQKRNLPTSSVSGTTALSIPEPQPVPTIRRARRITPEELNEPVVAIVADDAVEPAIRARVVRGPQDMQAASVRHTAATLSAPPEDFDHIVHLRGAFEDLPYPFDHAQADISVADYLLKELPDRENPVALYEAADAIGRALPPLQARVVGRLCQIAECVESHFGLPMLEDPPEPDVDLKESEDDNE